MKDRAIGVFDSGIGGLTVLDKIVEYLPYENTIYLGDTARVPYGIRSPETILQYSRENTEFLLKKDIKILIIACNTSSAVALEDLKKRYEVEIVGVVEPGARRVIELTKNKRVGVIGTEATIKSGAYRHEIFKMDPRIDVFEKACPLFVPLAEEGWGDNKIAIDVAKKYLSGIKKRRVDVLLLGCTHYPLLKGVIQRAIGNNTILVDSATEIAKSVLDILKKKKLLKKGRTHPRREFFVTDSPERFRDIGSRFFGKRIGYVEKVFLV